MKTRSAGIAAATLGLAAIALPAVAAPAAATPTTTTVCTADYLNPNLIGMPVQGSSTVSATPDGPGSVTLELTTDSKSIIGYEQDFTATWANLDTGSSGSAAIPRKKVVGADNVLTLPHVKTQAGQITFQFNIGNFSSVNELWGTNGQCGNEISVR